MFSISIEGKKTILFQMSNCICKIYLINVKKGVGFFCKIPFHNNNNLLPVLIINNYVDLDNNKIIKLIINNEVKEIKIDNSRKKYKNTKNNIVIIEIKPNKEKIYNYLELDANDIYKNESIYIIII